MVRRRGRSRRRWGLASLPSGRPGWALGLLALLLIGAPHLLGGVMPWAIITIAAVSTVTLAMTHASFGSGEPLHSALGFAVLACCLWTIVQALPLPCLFVEWVSPQSARELITATMLVDDSPPLFCTLSQDAGGTHGEVLKGCAIVTAYLAATLLSANGLRMEVLALVALSALVMALSAAGHELFEAQTVYGLYKPTAVVNAEYFLAPLMNPNNLGGFIVMGVPVMMGLADEAADAVERGLWSGAAAFSSLVVVATLSRGAIGTLLLVLPVFFLLRAIMHHSAIRAPRRPRARTPPSVATLQLATVLAGALILAIGGYAALGNVAKEFRDGDLSKLDLLRDAAIFSLNHPLLGVGRGAFSATFVADLGTQYRYVYPENLVIQWASEWGYPVALTLIFLLGWCALRTLRGAHSQMRMGGLLGLTAIFMQNQVDLGLELLGVAVVAAALLGAAMDPRVTPPHPAFPRPDLRRLSLPVVALAVVCLGMLGPGFPHNTISGLTERLGERMQQKDRKGFQSLLRKALRLHPREPELSLIAADEAIRAADPGVGRWLNRTMELAPGWPQPHLQAAVWLWNLGRRDQALLEIRAAAELASGPAVVLACSILRHRDPSVALQAAPRGQNRATFLERAVSCIKLDSPHAAEVDAALMKEYPRMLRPRLRQAQRMLRGDKPLAALTLLDTLIVRHPSDPDVRILRVRALLDAKRYRAAVHAVDEARRFVQDPTKLLTFKAWAHAHQHNASGVHATVQDLVRLARGRTKRLAAAHLLLAATEERMGNTGASIRALERAHRLEPSWETRRKLATMARLVGDVRREFSILSESCSIEPERGACEQLELLKNSQGR